MIQVLRYLPEFDVKLHAQLFKKLKIAWAIVEMTPCVGIERVFGND